MKELSLRLTELILAEHSRKQADFIASEVGPDVGRFAVLWQLMVHGEVPIPQRASYAIVQATELHPWLFEPYWEDAIQLLGMDYHPAIRRHLIKIMAANPLPDSETSIGNLVNHCFAFLSNATEPIAIRAHSMQVLFEVCKIEPDLGPELQMIIEEHLPYSSAGFRSRGKRIIKALRTRSAKEF